MTTQQRASHLWKRTPVLRRFPCCGIYTVPGFLLWVDHFDPILQNPPNKMHFFTPANTSHCFLMKSSAALYLTTSVATKKGLMLTGALSCLNHRSYFEPCFHEGFISNSLLSHHTSRTSWQSSRNLIYVFRSVWRGDGEGSRGVSSADSVKKLVTPYGLCVLMDERTQTVHARVRQ